MSVNWLTACEKACLPAHQRFSCSFPLARRRTLAGQEREDVTNGAGLDIEWSQWSGEYGRTIKPGPSKQDSQFLPAGIRLDANLTSPCQNR
jgi:hypothetical protein